MKAGVRKTVDELKNYMSKHGYTGLLYADENCGCSICDLIPCGEDHSLCELGWERECTPEEKSAGYDFMITNKNPKFKK